MQAQLNIPCTVYHWTCDIHVHAVWCTACIQHAQHKDKKFIAHKGISSFPARATLEKTLKCWKARPAWKQMQEPPLTCQGPRDTLNQISWLYWTCTHRFGSFFQGLYAEADCAYNYLFVPVASCIVLGGQTQPGATVPLPFVYIVLVHVHAYIVYTCVIEQQIKSKCPSAFLVALCK